MNWISNWIQGIIIAVIIGTIIEMLLPEGNCKKYVKVVIGVYILFSIVSPVITKVTGSEFRVSDIYDINSYIEASTKSTQDYAEINKENQIKQIYETNLKKDMKQKIEEKGYKVKSIFLELANDEQYTLKKINISLSLKEQNTEENDVKIVNEIQISVANNNENQTGDVKISYKEQENLKTYLSSVYNLDKKDIKQLTSKTDEGNNKKKIENLVFLLIILIVVLVAINFIWNDKKENVKTTDNNKKLAIQEETKKDSDSDLKEQLEDILQNINGVGKVKVLITYSQTSQVLPLYNEDTSKKDTEEKDKTGGTRIVTETDTKKDVIFQETNGNKMPITQSVISPKVEGAIVTAQGANNMAVKTDIIQAVEAVTGLSSHKIQVFTMSEN